ncbi:MAG TPA: malonate decarboxylase holo-[acyl-carrier-protein] synthase [Steroidobacteraceae bacterium]|jgi:phosphoribosyl-dephospho-CoA transferase|nr:malonate decarboxylase holo-[acyl-carrier-protein] synthase [Steroidobacteraceae bacterium]
MAEVVLSTNFQRHDLLRIDVLLWQALAAMQGEDTRACWLREWGARDWPVIVRRDDSESSPDSVAVGVPLPPSAGKLRVALHVPRVAMAARLSPVLLADCRRAAPRRWGTVLDRLEALGDATAIAPGVCGSLLWQHLTGLAYLHDASDIDVLWQVTSLGQARAIAGALPEIEHRTGIRVDGEILSARGWGVHWREFGTQAPEMLVKTRSSAQLCSRADVFENLDAAA